MTLQAQYQTTTPAFKLTTTPTSGYALAATDPSADGSRPLACYLQATTQNIRFTVDGSAPTSTVGMLLVAGADPFYYATGPLDSLRFIQVTSGAVLNVVYAERFDGPPGRDGVVQSVVAGTNVTVDASDPANPIVSADGSITAVEAGEGISVDNTDPQNPVISNAGVITIVAGTNITVDDTDPQNPVVASTGGGGSISVSDGSTTVDPCTSVTFAGLPVIDLGGGAAGVGPPSGVSVWSSIVTYSAGALVLDRGGTWQATGTNTNSRPVSGNTDWTLVGGEPYVDVVLGPVQLTTPPFSDSGSTLGYEFVPAPGAGLGLAMGRSPFAIVGTGVAYDSIVEVHYYYGDAADGNLATQTAFDVYTDQDPLDHPVSYYPSGNMGDASAATVENKPIKALDTIAGLGVNGTKSVLFRTFYNIIPAAIANQTAFYAITAVVQMAKTFTVTDADAVLNGATGTFDVVGSTMNDGTYTIVSAVSGAGSTVITVVEAIPDSTADGWAKFA